LSVHEAPIYSVFVNIWLLFLLPATSKTQNPECEHFSKIVYHAVYKKGLMGHLFLFIVCFSSVVNICCDIKNKFREFQEIRAFWEIKCFPTLVHTRV